MGVGGGGGHGGEGVNSLAVVVFFGVNLNTAFLRHTLPSTENKKLNKK